MLTPWDEVELALVLEGKAIPDHVYTPDQYVAWAENKIQSMIQSREAAEALRTHVSAPARMVLCDRFAPARLIADWNSQVQT